MVQVPQSNQSGVYELPNFEGLFLPVCGPIPDELPFDTAGSVYVRSNETIQVRDNDGTSYDLTRSVRDFASELSYKKLWDLNNWDSFVSFESDPDLFESDSHWIPITVSIVLLTCAMFSMPG
jgi:hypothetical protein